MSAFSISEPFPTFSNRNGQPLEAGYLYFGVAGLDPVTNPVTVYWDAALTIPAAQPVRTLNGYPSNNGTASRLYVNAGDFSTSVRDSKNTLVFTALNSTLRIPASSITGQFNASQVDYTQGDTGSQTRTVESKLQDTVSVFDFMTPAQVAGVKAGTFLVDVTAAIAAAIASPAREIYFPQGGYLVSDGGSGDPAIWIQANIVGKTLRGSGRQSTVIRNAGTGPAIGSDGTPIIPNTSIRIADMSIEGSPGTGSGIRFYYTSQSFIERVDCYGHGGYGIAINNGAHIAVNDAWSRSNTGNALNIGGEAYFVDVCGGTFESSSNGVEIDIAGGALSPRFVTFTGCAFRGNTSSNAYVSQARDVRFLGCSFQCSGGTTLRHLSVNGGAGLASGVVADACSFVGINTAATTIGIEAANCEDVAILNSVVDCTGAGAYTVAATAVRTRFFDNAVIVGTQTNASASTFTRTTLTGSSSLGFGGGEGLVNFDALANAMKMRRVPVSNLPAAGTTQLGVLQLRALDSAGLLSSEYRVWSRGGNLVGSLTDPANITDGITIGPGVQTYTFATRPASAPVGTIIKITDSNFALGWGQVETGGGIINRFIIHTGGNVWTVIGNG